MPYLSRPFGMPKIVLFFFALGLLNTNCLFGQQEQFKFRHLNIKNGLSDHEITRIYKDSRGFIWIATGFGLNRFDGYTVKQFSHDPRDTTSLPSNWVKEIFETPDGQLGLLTDAGLTQFNPETERFSHTRANFYAKYGTSQDLRNIVRDIDGSFWFIETKKVIKYIPANGKLVTFQPIKADTTSMVDGIVTGFSLGQDGQAWIIHENGIAEQLSVRKNGGRVSQRLYGVYNLNHGKPATYQIVSDTDGDLWVCDGSSQGVLYYDMSTKRLQQISKNSREFKLNTNTIANIIEARKGMIWVGTDHGGINVIDKRQKTVRYILHRDEDSRSLSENSIKTFYRDNQGIIWVGTYKRGVSYYHENIYRFDVFKHYSPDASSLPNEDINRFEEDAKGNLWIGTNGGGLLYFDRKAGTFKQYRHDPKNMNSLSGDVVVSLWVDTEQNLWIGTYNAGLNKFDGKNFTRFKHVPGDTTSLPSQNVWDLLEDSKGRFWVGTVDHGLAIMDKKTGKFHRLKEGDNSIRSTVIAAIIEDHKGRVWFGTVGGVDVLSPDGNFTHYEASAKENSLSNNRVLDIMEDSKGRIWLTTMDGLNLFIDSLKGFKIFKQQLPHHAVMDIREDNAGKLWMSSLNGLCEMTLADDDPDKASFKYYLESDGLQGTQFNIKAAFKTSAGELLFGGPTGFNIFTTPKNPQVSAKPAIVFTDLKVYQKSVNIGEDVNGVVILPNSISEAPAIVLPPDKNFFSIQLSSLNFFNPEKSQYLYKLDGINQDWLKVNDGDHEIAFSGLNPGNYKLRVKATDNDGFWSTDEKVLAITIQPPFWKTKTAIVLYGIFLIVIMYVARRLTQQREQLKFALEQERQEIRRVHELDLLKVKFFTNVSHEFRTPLTLILTPIDRLIKKAADPDQLTQFQLIQRNGKRLMKLVNQLLDFKKLEVQELKFNPSEGDLVAFVREAVQSFSDLAEKKNITLQFHTSIDHFETLFDDDKLEKILFNLLSNSLKFTLDNGTISVKLDHQVSEAGSFAEIQVSDTGIGIPQDKLDKIFEPFFQNDLPKSIVNQGSGIGLALVKEFVRIHGGTIKVASEVDKGSTFTVLLPMADIRTLAAPGQAIVKTITPAGESPADPAFVHDENLRPGRKTLLLVEDDDDVRFYLKDNLKFQYNIYEARNGAEGWAQVLTLQPDLIVSDIMMPELNGIDLCIKVKTDERVSHIPVILLTARSNEQQRLEGLKVGADDYITKPFNFEVLEARINNLLARQEKTQRSIRKTLDVKASELQITPLDEKFIANAIQCVEKNISSADFSVEDLGEELGISRAYVFKKIQALTGKTPLEFIRTIRLQHAAQLLEKSQLSVREIAYKVGFNSPKYFTKYFKEQFNVLPSSYASSKKENE